MSHAIRARPQAGAVLALGAVALAVLLAPADADAAASRAEYAQQADPICKSTDKDWGRLWRNFVRANKKLRFHAAGNALAAIGRRLATSNAALREIPPPPGDDALVVQWLGIWDVIAHKYTLAASAYRLGRYRQLDRLLKSANGLNRKASGLMADFPFVACA